MPAQGRREFGQARNRLDFRNARGLSGIGNSLLNRLGWPVDVGGADTTPGVGAPAGELAGSRGSSPALDTPANLGIESLETSGFPAPRWIVIPPIT